MQKLGVSVGKLYVFKLGEDEDVCEPFQTISGDIEAREALVVARS